jgi:hypothetical protein
MLAVWDRSVANLHVKDGHGLGEGLGDVHVGVQSQPKHSKFKIKAYKGRVTNAGIRIRKKLDN